MPPLRVIMDPPQRESYLKSYCDLKGIPYHPEDPLAAYCPISLTQTPRNLRKYLGDRQKILTKMVLPQSGIKSYDPSAEAHSPDRDLSADPSEVFSHDTLQILSCRFLVGNLIVGGFGVGVEVEIASMTNRISVMVLDAYIRFSRMLPRRVIYLQYQDFGNQAREFVPVFELLKRYDPGMGFNGERPVLIGFEKGSREVVDLEQKVYQEFPGLKYEYDSKRSTIEVEACNPDVMYEHKRLHTS